MIIVSGLLTLGSSEGEAWEREEGLRDGLWKKSGGKEGFLELGRGGG